jgi:hypothetical protein
MTSMARKVDPREAAAKRAAEEATRKALADKKAREAADTKAAEMAAALKAVQKKEAEEVRTYVGAKKLDNNKLRIMSSDPICPDIF